jgi:hypothetical protein
VRKREGREGRSEEEGRPGEGREREKREG